MKKNRRSGSKNKAAVTSVKNIPEPEEMPVPETALAEEIILQFGENEITTAAISEKVKKDYEESGNEAELKDIKVYVKPEDNKAYYVANGEIEGNVDLV